MTTITPEALDALAEEASQRILGLDRNPLEVVVTETTEAELETGNPVSAEEPSEPAHGSTDDLSVAQPDEGFLSNQPDSEKGDAGTVSDESGNCCQLSPSLGDDPEAEDDLPSTYWGWKSVNYTEGEGFD